MCLNAQAARSYLPDTIMRTNLVLAGRSEAQAFDALKAAFETKGMPPLESGAMGYLMSGQSLPERRDGHWHPHLMFFLPSAEAAAWACELFRNIRSASSGRSHMKTLRAATGAALLACNLAAFAQTEAACGQTLDAPLRSRAVLIIDSRPAGLEIVGTDQEAIHLSCTVRDAENARDIRIRLSGNQDDSKLTITGGSLKNTNLQIRIEVPRKTSLECKCPQGK